MLAFGFFSCFWAWLKSKLLFTFSSLSIFTAPLQRALHAVRTSLLFASGMLNGKSGHPWRASQSALENMFSCIICSSHLKLTQAALDCGYKAKRLSWDARVQDKTSITDKMMMTTGWLNDKYSYNQKCLKNVVFVKEMQLHMRFWIRLHMDIKILLYWLHKHQVS